MSAGCLSDVEGGGREAWRLGGRKEEKVAAWCFLCLTKSYRKREPCMSAPLAPIFASWTDDDSDEPVAVSQL